MAFFSLYIRRLTADESSSSADHRRRNPSLPSPNNRKGLDPSAIKSLPLIACSVAAKHRIEECTICLSEFQQREIVKVIPYCKHVYHPMCIDTWLSSHVTCPLCRSSQLFDEVSLGMKQQKNNNCVSGDGERSTVDNVAPWRDEERV
ncbi:RING-H2 finger protein ATL57-like [Olea europaea var. sylvestris]|uniref:RING-H2 finger protein ATL57-like n=1 Tax=Olea europaea var. sylvestris TaxID=158386 RepID=UPI000C1D0A68|nr:RING-H2 finger protein ATL57-like [Olea europaea var. sylvestris]